MGALKLLILLPALVLASPKPHGVAIFLRQPYYVRPVQPGIYKGVTGWNSNNINLSPTSSYVAADRSLVLRVVNEGPFAAHHPSGIFTATPGQNSLHPWGALGQAHTLVATGSLNSAGSGDTGSVHGFSNDVHGTHDIASASLHPAHNNQVEAASSIPTVQDEFPPAAGPSVEVVVKGRTGILQQSSLKHPASPSIRKQSEDANHRFGYASSVTNAPDLGRAVSYQGFPREGSDPSSNYHQIPNHVSDFNSHSTGGPPNDIQYPANPNRRPAPHSQEPDFGAFRGSGLGEQNPETRYDAMSQSGPPSHQGGNFHDRPAILTGQPGPETLEGGTRDPSAAISGPIPPNPVNHNAFPTESGHDSPIRAPPLNDTPYPANPHSQEPDFGVFRGSGLGGLGEQSPETAYFGTGQSGPPSNLGGHSHDGGPFVHQRLNSNILNVASSSPDGAGIEHRQGDNLSQEMADSVANLARRQTASGQIAPNDAIIPVDMAPQGMFQGVPMGVQGVGEGSYDYPSVPTDTRPIVQDSIASSGIPQHGYEGAYTGSPKVANTADIHGAKVPKWHHKMRVVGTSHEVHSDKALVLLETAARAVSAVGQGIINVASNVAQNAVQGTHTAAAGVGKCATAAILKADAILKSIDATPIFYQKRPKRSLDYHPPQEEQKGSNVYHCDFLPQVSFFITDVATLPAYSCQSGRIHIMLASEDFRSPYGRYEWIGELDIQLPDSVLTQVFPGTFRYVKINMDRAVHGLEYNSPHIAINGLMVLNIS